MTDKKDPKKKKGKKEAKPGDHAIHDPGGWGTLDMTPKKKKKNK